MAIATIHLSTSPTKFVQNLNNLHIGVIRQTGEKRMKRFLLSFLLLAGIANSQVKYSFVDSIGVTTSDSTKTYTNRFEVCNIMFSGCDGYVRWQMHSADTTGWALFGGGKHRLKLTDGSVLTIKPDANLGIPGVYKIQVSAVSGTGTAYIFGTRAVSSSTR